MKAYGVPDNAITWDKANDSLLGRPVFNSPARYVKTEDIDFILPCDDLTDWTMSGWDSTAHDTEHCLCGDKHQSISGIGGSVGNTFQYDFAPAVDLTGKVIVIRFYLHPEGDGVIAPQLNAKVWVKIYETGLENYATKEGVWYAPEVAADRTALPGWYEVAIPLCNLTELTGVPDLSDIARLKVIFSTSETDKNMRMTLDRVLVYTPANTKGYYVIRVDCGDHVMEKAVQVLSERGIRASFGISPFSTENIDALLAAQQMGHEIVHYTGGWPWSNWISKSLSQKVECLENAAACFRRNGFRPEGAKILHLSGGPGWTADDEVNLRGKYVEVVSGRGPGTTEYNGACNNLQSLWDPGKMYWTDFISEPNADEPQGRLPAAITKAEANKAVIVLGSHVNHDDGDAGNNEIAALKACADLLLASNLVNVTLGEIYRGEL